MRVLEPVQDGSEGRAKPIVSGGGGGEKDDIAVRRGGNEHHVGRAQLGGIVSSAGGGRGGDTCATPSVPMAVSSFCEPRVGNQAFANRVEGRGVKVLRMVNAHDLVTRVPTSTNGYAHVGRELRVDSRRSP
ncbi:hypothetical protein Cni_G14221 [Canna indica]|uniref:Fungal lipase-type domain-containing protein n=1 Tax=Canna indica TaxID=4628 RepID=A0AAQ3KFV8_9LILI|nr:hypothetical protein Cni_G14221 [Canna indica]